MINHGWVVFQQLMLLKRILSLNKNYFYITIYRNYNYSKSLFFMLFIIVIVIINIITVIDNNPLINLFLINLSLPMNVK
jgi:hypothetical protein